MPAGRPRMYETPEEMQAEIDNYFLSGVNIKKVIVGPPNNRQVVEVPIPTISGLVLYLGLSDRRSFYDYENRPEFSHTVKAARERIAQDYEEDLKNGLGAGAIFALKNFGWRDDQGLNVTGELTHKQFLETIIRKSVTNESS